MRPPGWRSYDSVAADYDRVAVPHLFAAPARDLVAALRPPRGGLVLDAGTGPGTVALLAAAAVGSGGAVVGIDSAVGMLRIARRRGILRLVAGAVPGLPFPDRTFDTVAAGFLISHFPDSRAGLADLVRVLRPGGRLGVTAWGETKSEFSETWKAAAESFLAADRLAEVGRQVVPSEDRFSAPAPIEQALVEAGLAQVRVEARWHRVAMRTGDFLAGREISGTGRCLRETLGPAEWERFRARVVEEFRALPDPVEYEAEALCGVGTRPAA